MELEKIISELYSEMRGRRFEQCEDIFEALAFIQEILAAALWKYNLCVNPSVEDFARDFDRIDTLAERQRIYMMATG